MSDDDTSSYKSCCSNCNSCEDCCSCSCKFYFICENTYREILVLHKLKNGQRIRNINNEIFIENRWSPLRFFSNDSRWNTLKDLRRLSDIYGKDNITINNAIEILSTTTYKKDSKWIKEVKKISQYNCIY